jgi:hypothetical protein
VKPFLSTKKKHISTSHRVSEVFSSDALSLLEVMLARSVDQRGPRRRKRGTMRKKKRRKQ